MVVKVERQSVGKGSASGKQGQGECVIIGDGRALRCPSVGIGDSIFLPVAASRSSATRATDSTGSTVSALSKGRKTTKNDQPEGLKPPGSARWHASRFAATSVACSAAFTVARGYVLLPFLFRHHPYARRSQVALRFLALALLLQCAVIDAGSVSVHFQ